MSRAPCVLKPALALLNVRSAKGSICIERLRRRCLLAQTCGSRSELFRFVSAATQGACRVAVPVFSIRGVVASHKYTALFKLSFHLAPLHPPHNAAASSSFFRSSRSSLTLKITPNRLEFSRGNPAPPRPDALGTLVTSQSQLRH